MKKILVNLASVACIFLVPYNAMYMTVVVGVLFWELYKRSSSLEFVTPFSDDLLFAVFGHMSVVAVATLLYFFLKKIRKNVGDEKEVYSWDRGMFAFALVGTLSFFLIMCLLMVLSKF